jgi:NAD(P)-dependent dehydrogenase (short-subunit alcohol dehydrogenase family)
MSYVDRMFGLGDIRAVVTGGAGVLPKAMAASLAKAGATVSIWGRGTSHPIDEAVEDLRRELAEQDLPGTIVGETVDTGDESAVAEALTATERAIGMPNLLINGVGGNTGKGPFVDIDTELFTRVLDLNLLAGLVIPTKIFAKRWIAEGVKGSIINVASMTSFVALSGVWAYAAAKSAVLRLTEGAANEFAPHGIRVNAVAPGFFVGHQNRALLIANDETGELTARGKAIIERTPFGRFGVADDLEGTTLFLASPRASGFLTGVCIPVDGGYLVDSI